jgi:hypothetical protein
MSDRTPREAEIVAEYWQDREQVGEEGAVRDLARALARAEAAAPPAATEPLLTRERLAAALAAEAMDGTGSTGLQPDGTPYPADLEWADGVLRLLAGDKADPQGWTTEQAIDLGRTLAKRGRELSAGDKAEAPR